MRDFASPWREALSRNDGIVLIHPHAVTQFDSRFLSGKNYRGVDLGFPDVRDHVGRLIMQQAATELSSGSLRVCRRKGGETTFDILDPDSTRVWRVISVPGRGRSKHTELECVTTFACESVRVVP